MTAAKPARSRGEVETFFRYLPVSEGLREWGLYVASVGYSRIQEGNLFVLFPGVWHRYSPDSTTGWDEHWVEFDGDYARRFLAPKDLQPSAPVLSVGLDERLVDLFGLDLRATPLRSEAIWPCRPKSEGQSKPNGRASKPVVSSDRRSLWLTAKAIRQTVGRLPVQLPAAEESADQQQSVESSRLT